MILGLMFRRFRHYFFHLSNATEVVNSQHPIDGIGNGYGRDNIIGARNGNGTGRGNGHGRTFPIEIVFGKKMTGNYSGIGYGNGNGGD